MKCKYFNPSRRSVKSRASMASPTSPDFSRQSDARQSISPTDLSFGSSISSTPPRPGDEPERQHPSTEPKTPSPLSKTVELTDEKSLEVQDGNTLGMDIDG